MDTKFFGLLKGEGDIAFHFGFEGCEGYREFYEQLAPYEILYAHLDDYSEIIPGVKGFYMVVRSKEAQTFDSGLFYTITLGEDATPHDFVFVPVSVEELQQAASINDEEMEPPEGFVDFVNNTFPQNLTEEEDDSMQLVDAFIASIPGLVVVIPAID